MSSYHNKFIYKGVSNQDKHLIVVSFSPDTAETDSFLSMESIYTDKYDGSVRYDYGARYNSVSTINITLINEDKSDITVEQFRSIAKWLTGARLASWLDLYNDNDEIAYSFLCKCVDLQHYKMDSRTIGVIATFESVSPWAYSPIQTIVQNINGETEIILQNNSDDLYSYLYPDITFVNTSGDTLTILNTTTQETVQVVNLTSNEQIMLKSNQIITSSISHRIFGNDFNFTWLRLIAGQNTLSVNGQGTITISYRYPIKIGDCVIDK